MAGTLGFTDFAAFVSSPLQRALDTANILQDRAGIDTPIVADEAFTEWSIPPWDRLTFAEIETRFTDEFQRFGVAPHELALPGAETLHDVQVRALDGVGALQRANPNASVLVVTHAAVVAAILCGLLDVPLSAYRRFPIANASLTMIEIAHQPMLQLFNWHPSKLV
jgi:broad specificity phosphatase PhoE